MKKLLLPLLLLPALAHASLLASGGTETLLDGDTEAVHKFTSDGTFTLLADATVRILVVGGGGGGGGDCAPGGGGGGVIDTNDVHLAAGRYAIMVGAGGILGSTTRIKGQNGGDSVVARIEGDGSKTELLRAYGGGGAGAYGNGAGLDGGCGGGGWGSPGHGVPGQGYDAVADSGPGAGGGAGGSPVAANVGAGSATQHQADGGPGRASDITGTTEYYGPGGGSGGYNGWGGLGGDQSTLATEGWIWGCGWSHSSAQSDEDMTAAGRKQDGRDGYGGGGGGSSNTHYAGGMGGSGVVIVRLANVLTQPEPMVGASTIAPSWFSAEIPAVVSFAGAGSTSGDVALWLQFSGDAADFGADGTFAGTETLLDAHFFGSGSFSVTDLKPAHGYFVRLVARNDAGAEAWTAVIPFSTLAQAETQWIRADGRKCEDGLLMYRTGLGFEAWAEPAGGLYVARETFTASLSSGGSAGKYGLVYVAPDGTQWKFPSGVSDWYETWMWMEAGRQYNFFAKFWDNFRFYLDGSATEYWHQSNYGRADTFSVTPAETGWRNVRIWFGGSGGGAGAFDGFDYGFGWNVDGATAVSGKPGTADWHMFGVDDGALLKTVKPGREVSIAGYAADGDDLAFSVALAAGNAATVGAVWGAAYPADPDDTNAWASAAAVGAADAAAQTLPATVPATAKYARFYAVQSDGTLCWSPTAQIDLTAVSVAALGATADGDRATMSVRVGSVGTGAFSLVLLTADNAAMAGAATNAIAASAPGDYSITVAVTPGATTYYRFVGTTTDGGFDQTAVSSVTTLAGTVLPENPSVSVANRTITVTMPDLSFGAGVQSFHVVYGPSDDETQWLTDTAVVAAPRSAGGYAITFARPELPATWRFRLVSVNTAPGGTSWTSRTAVLSATTTDSVTYTWKRDVAEGSWTNAANWTLSSSDGLGTGYPSNRNCKVQFPANCTATIHIPAGAYPTATYHLNANGSHIVLAGEGRGVSVLSGDGYGGTMRGETFEFRSMTVNENDRFDNTIGEYSDFESTNAVLRVADGGYLRMGSSYQNVRGTNAAIRVEGGSELYMGELNPVQLNGAGETLLVDDSLLTVYSIVLDYGSSLGPQTARFAGRGAKAIVTSGLFADVSDRAAVHDFTLLFEPASGGYTNGPVLFSSATASPAVPLGTMRNAGSTAKFRVAVDTARMKRAAKTARGFAIAWKAGILEENVVLVPGQGYTLHCTYGWDAGANLPLDLREPENEGDLPTGVWFEAPTTANTLILVK